MNSDDFPVEKINVLPVSFHRIKGKRRPGYIINDEGHLIYTVIKMKNQVKTFTSDEELVNHLVSERGFIHIWPNEQFLFISLRPHLVNMTSVTACFYVIACFRPARVLISTDVENTEWEVFSGGHRAMTRIEDLVTAFAKA